MIWESVKPAHVARFLFVVICIGGVTLYQTDLWITSDLFLMNKQTLWLGTINKQGPESNEMYTLEKTLVAKPDVINISTTKAAKTRVSISNESKPVPQYIRLSQDEISQLNEALRNATDRV